MRMQGSIIVGPWYKSGVNVKTKNHLDFLWNLSNQDTQDADNMDSQNFQSRKISGGGGAETSPASPHLVRLSTVPKFITVLKRDRRPLK